jgi:hypothetical protein
MLGLGSRDQDSGVHQEGAPEELLLLEEIGHRLTGEPAFEQARELVDGRGGHLVTAVGQQLSLAQTQHPRQQ